MVMLAARMVVLVQHLGAVTVHGDGRAALFMGGNWQVIPVAYVTSEVTERLRAGLEVSIFSSEFDDDRRLVVIMRSDNPSEWNQQGQ